METQNVSWVNPLWLVVYLALWKIWVHELVLWHSQYMGKIWKSVGMIIPNIIYIYIYILYIYIWKVIKFMFQTTNQFLCFLRPRLGETTIELVRPFVGSVGCVHIVPIRIGLSYPLVNCHITMENHYFEWENQLFLWQFSIANCLFTRG